MQLRAGALQQYLVQQRQPSPVHLPAGATALVTACGAMANRPAGTAMSNRPAGTAMGLTSWECHVGMTAMRASRGPICDVWTRSQHLHQTRNLRRQAPPRERVGSVGGGTAHQVCWGACVRSLWPSSPQDTERTYASDTCQGGTYAAFGAWKSGFRSGSQGRLTVRICA